MSRKRSAAEGTKAWRFRRRFGCESTQTSGGRTLRPGRVFEGTATERRLALQTATTKPTASGTSLSRSSQKKQLLQTQLPAVQSSLQPPWHRLLRSDPQMRISCNASCRTWRGVTAEPSPRRECCISLAAGEGKAINQDPLNAHPLPARDSQQGTCSRENQ